MPKIIICGGGNGAHVFAVLAKRFLDNEGMVGIYAPYKDEAEIIKKGMDENNGVEVVFKDSVVKEKIDIVSKCPSICQGADLIVFIAPAFAHEKMFKNIVPFISDKTTIGAIPARSGFEFSITAILEEHKIKNTVLFAGQTLPWACRLETPGKKVKVFGIKEKVGVATIPSQEAKNIAKILSDLSSVMFYPVDNILAISLSNIGQIVHPGIMYGLFKDFTGIPYSEPPLFYQGLNDEIALILEEMSQEIQDTKFKIEKIYPEINLNEVKSLKNWLIETYGTHIEDKSTLLSSFITNKGYDGLRAPMQKKENGYFPDYNSRYLTEDVPTGLVVTKAMAEICNVPTPRIDQVLSQVSEWMDKEYLKNGKLLGKDVKETRAPYNYGINNLESLVSCSIVKKVVKKM